MEIKHRIEVIVGVLIFLVVSASGCSNPSTQTTFPMMTNVSGLNSGSSESANSLSLSLSLDSMTYKPGKNVSIILDETNALSTANNVLVSDNWPYNHLHSDPCDFISPFGIAVFKGDYTSSNFSTATPLTIYDPHATRLCTTNYAINSYSFQPSNDMADIIENSNPNPSNYSQQMKYEVTINGYWPDNNYYSNSRLTKFSPGVYTVVGGDEWGALVILHFTVSQ